MADSDSSIRRHRRLPPLAALRAFEAAARHLSFRKAAEELAVTPTAVSHQIRLLEAVLGRALFVRHVRRVALTAAGERLYPVFRDGFDSFEQAISALDPQSQRKAVTLTAPTLFTARRLLPALDAFRSAHPGFDLRLHAADEVVDLHAGLADIAVRYGPGPFPRLVAEPLMSERFGVLCSPRLGLCHPDDLRTAVLIHTEWKRPGMAPDWQRWRRLSGATGLAIGEGPRFTDDGHALQAAIAGHGAVIASLVLARPEIEAGMLFQPFGPEIVGETYHIVATPENIACADVRAVRDWLADHVSGETPLRENRKPILGRSGGPE
ncbi:LysR family transcriptional regulator [Rhizobium rhizosphaerae]|uniref:LysR family transcriptional regulator n=1 Tax=Xaviernesmea rhizosphaerae TaxID=1672749 RepID=A0A1Q9AGT9_9HYPH|nr:LysR substrate-binding domain-containing protein [Xaviernesmea rhizosphaerae]OLP54400.1 LysR family transcriptional regulator [Xaviernesmea rhizosphaerae]